MAEIELIKKWLNTTGELEKLVSGTGKGLIRVLEKRAVDWRDSNIEELALRRQVVSSIIENANSEIKTIDSKLSVLTEGVKK